VEAGYRLAYDEVVRALSQQAAVLEGLRARAGVLLSAASVATSFLGGTALQRGGLSPFAWAAVLAFVAHAASLLVVVWPRDEPVGAVSAARFIAEYVENPERNDAESVRNLALYLERGYVARQAIADRLAGSLRLAALLLAGEVALWVLSIASVG
jgi:hypothetical protein